MKKWDVKIYQKLYDKLKDLILSEYNLDEEYKRYISDLSNGFLFYYFETGKIYLSENDKLIPIFKDRDMHLMLKPDIQKIIDELKYSRN